MPKILIVGGGYAGFYTAWNLEKKLRRGEAQVTIIDSRPYMTYQPFLPEVMASDSLFGFDVALSGSTLMRLPTSQSFLRRTKQGLSG